MEQGCWNVAARIVAAEDRFIAYAIERAGLTREQALVALATMRQGGKRAPLKLDGLTGQFTFSHGVFGEPDVLRRAAGLAQE